MAAAALILALAGCSAPIAPTVHTVATAAMHAKQADRTTGLGNPYSVKLESWGPEVSLSYDDKNHYFMGWALNAYVQVTLHDGRKFEYKSVSMQHPSGGTSVYGGHVHMDGYSTNDVASVAVAFFEHDKWDSNFGKNYVVNF
jgi:hypothetical protein